MRCLLQFFQADYAAATWTVLERFGYAHILQGINGKLIHRLENIMTMTTTVHDAFDRLALWFEATVRSYNTLVRALPIVLRMN